MARTGGIPVDMSPCPGGREALSGESPAYPGHVFADRVGIVKARLFQPGQGQDPGQSLKLRAEPIVEG